MKYINLVIPFAPGALELETCNLTVNCGILSIPSKSFQSLAAYKSALEFSFQGNRPFPHSNKQWHRVEVGVDKNTVNVGKCPPQPRSGAIVRTH